MPFIRELTQHDASQLTLAALKNLVRQAETLKMADDAEVFFGDRENGFQRLRSITLRGC